MGENHELKNRYMLVNAPAEWTSNEQVENKHRTSTEQAEQAEQLDTHWEC